MFPHSNTWMQQTEGEILEFKEARSRFDFEELTRYCVALANEGGGKIIFGATDDGAAPGKAPLAP